MAGTAPNADAVDLSDMGDIIDELEAELMKEKAPAAEAKLAAEKAQTARAEEESADIERNPLVAIFLNKDIRVGGTVEKPEFCALDVSEYIGDKDYKRNLKKYITGATAGADAYLFKRALKDATGRPHETMFMSENALYCYLFRSDLPKAIEFQDYAYTVIHAERLRVVDARLLAMKIERDLAQSQLHTAKIERSMARSETGEVMRVANDLRAEVKKLKAQASKKATSSYAADLAKLRELEEYNRTRSAIQSAARPF